MDPQEARVQIKRSRAKSSAWPSWGTSSGGRKRIFWDDGIYELRLLPDPVSASLLLPRRRSRSGARRDQTEKGAPAGRARARSRREAYIADPEGHTADDGGRRRAGLEGPEESDHDQQETGTTDALEILRRRYIDGRPENLASLEEERVHAEVARQIYDLRTWLPG